MSKKRNVAHFRSKYNKKNASQTDRRHLFYYFSRAIRYPLGQQSPVEGNPMSVVESYFFFDFF